MEKEIDSTGGSGLENFRQINAVSIAVKLFFYNSCASATSKNSCLCQVATIIWIAIKNNRTILCIGIAKLIIALRNMLSQHKIFVKYLGFLILLHLEFPLQNASGGANAQEWRVKGQTAGFSLITVIIAQRTRFVNVFLQKMQLFPRLRPEFPYVSR